jgi:hypothetical protein
MTREEILCLAHLVLARTHDGESFTEMFEAVVKSVQNQIAALENE